ncbi:hypothetical protein EYF80_026804 [Liparis tanakae]|uniref:Uncharacterized protein n=1 Tax=Liparis tanakae TaxID=230148 RepID=A0A4Z2HCI9_9TELE|nr:hypothetical protein EYF80_026804 [Liparis tanakae]
MKEHLDDLRGERKREIEVDTRNALCPARELSCRGPIPSTRYLPPLGSFLKLWLDFTRQNGQEGYLCRNHKTQPHAGDLLWVSGDQQWDDCHVILHHLDLHWLLWAELWGRRGTIAAGKVMQLHKAFRGIQRTSTVLADMEKEGLCQSLERSQQLIFNISVWMTMRHGTRSTVILRLTDRGDRDTRLTLSQHSTAWLSAGVIFRLRTLLDFCATTSASQVMDRTSPF